ncbi:MAG: hypothetical protein K2N27_00800 [Ruminococcus sp.]|nr:hypothetical protein [Ruminococcus sp.]
MKFKKIVSSVLAVAMSVAFTASFYVPYIENQSFVSYASEGINVAQHTQDEIKQYIEAHPFDMKAQPVYTVQPSTTAPYEIGKLDSATEENALNALNCMRYIAGLPEVTLDEEYSRLAQAAAFVNHVNGSLSHYPEQPAGVPDDIYQLGKTGASSSNLSRGTTRYNLAQCVINGYMYDSDNSNISRVGHRRWCINPSMAKTGFGTVGNTSGMYSIDRSRQKTESNVCWPAQNMPTEYFSSSTAWSISLNKTLFEDYVEVKLVRSSDKQEWNFSTSSADGDFYVDNGYYAEPGCIIFRPSDISYNDGDKFDVKITTEDSTIEYSVNFFSLDVKENEQNVVGDIDNSKKIDVFDVIAMKNGFVTDFSGWSYAKMKTADINGDDMLSISDLVLLQQYLLGQIKNFG